MELPDFASAPAPSKKKSGYAFYKRSGGSAPPPMAGQKPKPKPRDGCFVKENGKGMSFVITGVQESLERGAVEALIKACGGLVKSGVSGVTDYLLAGVVLEDGRQTCESSKYRKASGKFAKTCAVEDDYSENVEAKSSSSSSGSSSSKTNDSSHSNVALSAADNQLWSVKHRPREPRDLVGNTDTIKRMTNWLNSWSSKFSGKACLLSGPPGIGKTSAAMLVARAAGFEPLEFNASDKRSKSAIKELCEATNSSSIASSFSRAKSFGASKKRVLIMDEVDGMGGGDRGGCAALADLIRSCKSPVICICNDVQSKKISSLKSVCLDLPFRRPHTQQVARRMMIIAKREGLAVEMDAMMELVDSTGNDIRQVITALQMYARSSKQLSSQEIKDKIKLIKKDSIIRLTPMDGSKVILGGGGKGRKSIGDRLDGFFIDFSMVPLLVQQSYVDTQLDQLKRMALAADAICDADVVSQTLNKKQDYVLLPTVGMLNVQAGFYAAGPPTNNSGYSGGGGEWFGKNSKRTKHKRWIAEMALHVNTVTSCSSRRIRMDYMEMMRISLLGPLYNKKIAGIGETLDRMAEYGLSRDDLFETMKEIHLGTPGSGVSSSAAIYNSIESKTQSAFTREYNKRGLSQSTQALAASNDQVTASTFSKKISKKDMNARLKKMRAEKDRATELGLPYGYKQKSTKSKKRENKSKGKGKGKRSQTSSKKPLKSIQSFFK
eukprot:GSMAST32.ASY1.ANO1.1716.1 assembled CDS